MLLGIIFLLFSFWRIADLIIAYVAHLFDRYNEHFIYKFQLYHYNPLIPKFLIPFANYDGAHYLHIAHNGYQQYEQAFFPLFPLLIHLLSLVSGSQFFLPGFLLANTCFLAGLYFFGKYLESVGKNTKTIVWIFLFLLSFPTSFFFGAVYTEGLFFLLVTASLYFAQKKRFGVLAVTSILAALTRLMGVFLIIPFFTTLLIQQQNLTIRSKKWSERVRELLHFLYRHKNLVVVCLSPFLGLMLYMIYLLYLAQSPFSFYSSLTAFNTGRTTKHIILLPQVYYRYLHIIITSGHNVTYFVAVVEFLTFNLFLIVLLYDLRLLWRTKHIPARVSLIGLNLFSLVNLLLPTFTGTLTSLPRYILLSLSFFIRISQMRSIVLRIVLILLFTIFHIILLTLFIQGYFVS